MEKKYYKEFLKCHREDIYIQEWERETCSDLEKKSPYQLLEIKKQIEYTIFYLGRNNTNNFNIFFGNLLTITGSLFAVLVAVYTSLSETFNELYSFSLAQNNFLNAEIAQNSKHKLIIEFLNTFSLSFIVFVILIFIVFFCIEKLNKRMIIKNLYYSELLKIVDNILKNKS